MTVNAQKLKLRTKDEAHETYMGLYVASVTYYLLPIYFFQADCVINTTGSNHKQKNCFSCNQCQGWTLQERLRGLFRSYYQ